jgi:methionine aminopeptidase
MLKRMAIQSFVITWGMASDVGCMRILRFRTTVKPGKGVKIKKGYVFAIEPMVNMGSLHTKTLKDGWTVVTVDGQPSAH